jgi:hypothetical protein
VENAAVARNWDDTSMKIVEFHDVDDEGDDGEEDDDDGAWKEVEEHPHALAQPSQAY